MKITVDISDSLLAAAKKAALQQRTTVRALIERGLRQVLAESIRRERFQLRRASFKGQGLQTGVTEGTWDHLRDLISEEPQA